MGCPASSPLTTRFLLDALAHAGLQTTGAWLVFSQVRSLSCTQPLNARVNITKQQCGSVAPLRLAECWGWIMWSARACRRLARLVSWLDVPNCMRVLRSPLPARPAAEQPLPLVLPALLPHAMPCHADAAKPCHLLLPRRRGSQGFVVAASARTATLCCACHLAPATRELLSTRPAAAALLRGTDPGLLCEAYALGLQILVSTVPPWGA